MKIITYHTNLKYYLEKKHGIYACPTRQALKEWPAEIVPTY